jgi:hypothetical protein
MAEQKMTNDTEKMTNDTEFKKTYNDVSDLFTKISMIDPDARNTIMADNDDGLQVSVGSIYADAGYSIIPKIENDMRLSPAMFNKSYKRLLNAKTAINDYLTQQQPQQAGRRRGTKRRGTKRRGTKRRGTKRRRSSRK